MFQFGVLNIYDSGYTWSLDIYTNSPCYIKKEISLHRHDQYSWGENKKLLDYVRELYPKIEPRLSMGQYDEADILTIFNHFPCMRFIIVSENGLSDVYTRNIELTNFQKLLLEDKNYEEN